eukprot:681016-Rhodomonas_salina.2
MRLRLVSTTSVYVRLEIHVDECGGWGSAGAGVPFGGVAAIAVQDHAGPGGEAAGASQPAPHPHHLPTQRDPVRQGITHPLHPFPVGGVAHLPCGPLATFPRQQPNSSAATLRLCCPGMEQDSDGRVLAACAILA